ncbi:MAG: sensor histidine kinase [Alphaproteobacteria bacterium]|nr:sensor histidine kinase [Alphaproteobacteria bacterium]
MMNSTKSKRSTGSDTGTAKSNRWFRIGSNKNEIEQLFDLYWGGSERRITKLTLRIMGINAVALLSLLFGMIYLSQYQEKLISSKIEIFRTEVYLIANTLMEGALVSYVEGEKISQKLSENETKNIANRLGLALQKRILVFRRDGELVADTDMMTGEEDIAGVYTFLELGKNKEELKSLEILKKAGRFFLNLLPNTDTLKTFQGINSTIATDYPDVVDAFKKKLSMTAWKSPENEHFVLTGAMPIFDGNEIIGAILVVNSGEDVRKAMGDAWFDILKIFLMTLLVTILISIYLSGLIASPLKKLASAAENVRRGKFKYDEIPDMRDRNDEIGELSVVLREMTQALWERMDTIELFAADVAHEIKNPLTSLKSAVETASKVKKKADQDKLLAIVQHDIERLDRLITDISNASKLDAELSREEFNILDLGNILRNLVDMYKDPLEREKHKGNEQVMTAIKDGVKIELTLPEKQINIWGSEGRLIQVFQNILSNALSFSPVGSTIRISLEKKAKRVMVFWEDEGPGIPEGKLGNVFERFYSERPEHEAYGKHSGLGLSICRQIVLAHNGMIFAENIKDKKDQIKGARFVVILNTV